MMKRTIASFAALASVAALAADAVKVSDFGYDAADSTEFIRAALASGAKRVVLDRQAGPWYTLPLKMPSNVEFVLEPGVELVAKRGEYKGLRDYLLELPSCTNVTIRGGEGSTLRMWKKDYQGPDYKHGEWRYALRIHKCKNVLVEGLTIVESGGDGIGVTGTDITIRNCVCDRNHRQGMSVFNVRNLLVENCVFSNTQGTPPQAGVDIEPDSAGERLENVVFRNCKSFGNAGAGFEAYLVQLRKSSCPVSISFENCSAWGNRRSCATLSCSRDLGVEPVGGTMRYVGCNFASSDAGSGCVSLSSIPKGAVDVVFRDTVLSNATDRIAVRVGVADPLQGRPDGIDFGNLEVRGVGTNGWFACNGTGVGGVENVKGEVTLVGRDGSRKTVKIDDRWIGENLPEFDNGRPLPRRRGLPDLADVVVEDSAPGELADVEPLTVLSKTPLVFFADKPGECRFVFRQVIAVPGLSPSDKPLVIEPVGKGRKRSVPLAGTGPVEYTFKAPKRGFYRILMPKWRSRLRVDKSSVPLAVDVSDKRATVAPLGGKPFSLWFADDGSPWVLTARGSEYYRFGVSVRDSAGAARAESPLVDNVFIARGEGCAPGFCTVAFRKAAQPHYDHISIGAYGMRGFLFMTPSKRWR